MSPMLSLTSLSSTIGTWTLLGLAMIAALVVLSRSAKRAPRRVPVRTRDAHRMAPERARDTRGCDWR